MSEARYQRWLFKEWYQKNKAAFAKKRKKRYDTDKTYRETVLRQNKEWRARTSQAKRSLDNRAVSSQGLGSMFDVKKETERLVQRFIAQLEAIGAQMTAETKAVSWSMAAEVIAAGLQAIAVGSLTWEDDTSVKQTQLTAPMPKKPLVPRTKPQVHVGVIKASIKGPKPKERAERYRDLLNNQTGFWSRRDSKVQYECFGIRLPSSRQGNAVFYRMKRTDNGEEKDVKFTSIVSDWKYYDA